MKTAICLRLLFVFIVAGFTSCKLKIDPNLPVARQGIMDLSDFDINKKGKFSLDGEWAFYYNQLLYPADFKNHTDPLPDAFMNVPGYWNETKEGIKKFNGCGYATYRLLLTNYHFNSLMALRIWETNSAYRLWINDELISFAGVVSANPDSVVPKIIPRVKPFYLPPGDSLQIILQIANTSHVNGGLRSSIDIGEADTIIRQRDNSRNAELWMAAIMFILFVYHLLIFLLRKKEYAALWFALLCLDSTIRNLITGEYIFYTSFPGFPYAAGIRIEYLTVTMGVPIYVMLAFEFFKQEWSLYIRNSILLICVAESLLIIFFPVRVFTGFLSIILLFVLLESVYLVYIVIRAMINKREFAIISFISYCICFAGIVHDVLVARLVINDSFIIFYAFSGFLLMQAYILAYRNSVAYKKIEILSEELNEANITLEKKVEDRTAALNLTNSQLTDEKRKSDELLLNI
ncbi:MAG: 7TM-DISM domain-containing protein [Sphingobacteriales bacterium]|nr:7TM-DISM domain-containing protein [Sphingobacteriales bacterium]